MNQQPLPDLRFLTGYSVQQQLADRDRENAALRQELTNACILIHALVEAFGGTVALTHHSLMAVGQIRSSC
jgi:hypothetical protein